MTIPLLMPRRNLARPQPRAVAWQHAGHIPALDGVRGLALLLVLFHHFTILPGTSMLDRAVFNLGVLGVSGVDLFFVLSGFLITGILFDSKGAPHYFRNFYARRTLRIFPLYYAAVFISLVVLPMMSGATFDRFRNPVDPWSYWLYVSNLSMAYHGEFRHGILDVTWSLAIEEQFYLIWPMVVLALGRRSLMRVCLGIVAFALVLRTTMTLSGVNWVATYLLTPCRMDGLVIGSFIALAARGEGIEWLVRPAKIIAPLFGAIFAMVILTQGFHYYETPLGRSLGPTLVSGIYGSLLVATLRNGATNRCSGWFAQRWICIFGKYSYALYIVHVPVFSGIREAFYGENQFHSFAGSQLPGQILFYVIATAVSLALAWLSWHLFERQFLKLKRLFPSPTKQPAPDTMPQPEHRDRPIFELSPVEQPIPLQMVMPEPKRVELAAGAA